MAERRIRIIDAATELLGAGAVEALTMRALSESAGVSVPTIYNLVGGRDDVLVAVLERLGTVFDAEIATLTANPVDRCFDITAHFVTAVTGRMGLARSILAEGLAPLFAQTDASPLRRYRLALGPAVLAAADQREIELVTSPDLLVDQLVALTTIRFFQWARVDSPGGDDDAIFRAQVAHGVGLTLAAVATDHVRPGVLQRITEAERTLTNQREGTLR